MAWDQAAERVSTPNPNATWGTDCAITDPGRQTERQRPQAIVRIRLKFLQIVSHCRWSLTDARGHVLCRAPSTNRPDHFLPPPRLTHSFSTAGRLPLSVAMNRSAALPGAGRQRGAAAPVGEPDVPPVRIGKGPVERSPLPPVGKLAPLDGPVGIGRVPATPGRAYPGPKRKGRRNSTARVAAPWATRSSRPWPAPS